MTSFFSHLIFYHPNLLLSLSFGYLFIPWIPTENKGHWVMRFYLHPLWAALGSGPLFLSQTPALCIPSPARPAHGADCLTSPFQTVSHTCSITSLLILKPHTDPIAGANLEAQKMRPEPAGELCLPASRGQCWPRCPGPSDSLLLQAWPGAELQWPGPGVGFKLYFPERLRNWISLVLFAPISNSGEFPKYRKDIFLKHISKINKNT